MIVEVIAVGTELLIGQIVNSNAAVIGARLAEDGFDAHFQVTVGDNLDRLKSAIESALARSDAVVLTGGIGPTQDDLTREAMAAVAGRSMTRDEEHARWIEDRIRAQRGAVGDTVLRMADLPEGAEGLPNSNGAALGVALQHEGKWMFAIPGVPVEMSAMLEHEVIPRLRRLAGDSTVLRSRVLRTWGMGESRIADQLDDLFASTNPSVAFLISDMEVKVRISAKAADERAAETLIAPIETEVRDRLGDAVFAADDETVESILLHRLIDRGWKVATVEEATLGQVGARLAAADTAEVFAGSIIVGDGAEVGRPEADVTLVVGSIGPDLDPGRRTTRRVEMRVATPDGETGRVFDFGGDDERVRSFATIAGLHLIRLALDQPASSS
ncbi:MAG TPA: CinA family nicotinamide mononucleotide deamidase-related protein [Acidimicrobiia bacterium]|nr:CinA family nicotinamide mononucleotide deamidase-related protein [Acidimicrobiia bacterium]